MPAQALSAPSAWLVPPKARFIIPGRLTLSFPLACRTSRPFRLTSAATLLSLGGDLSASLSYHQWPRAAGRHCRHVHHGLGLCQGPEICRSSSLHFVYGGYGYSWGRHFYSPSYSPKFFGFRFRGSSGFNMAGCVSTETAILLTLKSLITPGPTRVKRSRPGKQAPTAISQTPFPTKARSVCSLLGGAGLLAWRRRRRAF